MSRRRRRSNPKKLLTIENIAIGAGVYYAYKKGWLNDVIKTIKG